MTEMTRRLLPAGTTAAPFAGWARVVDAAVPKDTAVFAKQADTGAAARNLPPHPLLALGGHRAMSAKCQSGRQSPRRLPMGRFSLATTLSYAQAGLFVRSSRRSWQSFSAAASQIDEMAV